MLYEGTQIVTEETLVMGFASRAITPTVDYAKWKLRSALDSEG